MKRMVSVGIAAVILLFPSLLCPELLYGQSSAKKGKSPDKAPEKSAPAIPVAAAVATVDGQTLTEDDLAPVAAGQLRQLHDQEYQIKKKALDTLINQKLLEAEAKKKGVTTEKLYEQEVDAKVPEPTEIELSAIYAVQKEQLSRPFEEVKAQLQQNLKRVKTQQARQEYSAHLRDQARIAILLSPPRIQVGFDTGRVRGNPKARVMIVEFSDYQCPYCGQVEATLKSVLAKHEGSVALAFRDMPITQIHPLAQGAAEASRCAGEQGKFWEYHDLLFADQGGLDRNGLIAKAAKLQLDAKQFDTCISSEKFKAQVLQDNQDGMRAGVSGTPGFFINGVFMSGAQPESAFEKAIQEQLAASPAPKS